MTCPWWIRWWHRLLRRRDSQRMLSMRIPPGGVRLGKHWRCPCGKAYREAVLSMHSKALR